LFFNFFCIINLLNMNHRRGFKTKKTRQIKSAPSRANTRSQLRQKLKNRNYTEADYKKQLDALLYAKKGANRIEKSQIEMSDAQSSQVYLILLKLILMGADSMAKNYAKKAKINYSELRKEALKNKQKNEVRKVGSRRVKSAKPIKIKSLTSVSKLRSGIKSAQNFIGKKIKGDREWYETNHPGGVDYTQGVKTPKL
jgi:hypothetical protein